jgi:HlyD family secretion protein
MKVLFAAPLTLFLIGCAHQDDPPSKPLVAVKVAKAEEATLRMTVTAPATVFPREQASVAARITAPIRELRVRKGDRVDAGQIVAVLEDRDILAQRDEARAALDDAEANLLKITAGTLPTDIERARGELASAEAALNQAEKNYQRRSELFKQGAIPGRELLASETDLKQAKAAHEVAKRALDLLESQSRDKEIRIAESRVSQAKARLALAEAQRQFAEIRSPFTGVVTDQFMYPGDMAKPENPIFTIMDLAVAVARAQVPEAEAAPLRRGQACSFKPVDGSPTAADPGGRITVVNTAVDLAKRTVEVWCEIPNNGQALRAGSFGNVTIVTGTLPGALVVPLSAVQFNEGTRSGAIYIVDGRQVAHRTEVATGEREDGKVQVLKGVKAGDAVIVEGGYGLPDGTPVQVQGAGK